MGREKWERLPALLLGAMGGKDGAGRTGAAATSLRVLLRKRLVQGNGDDFREVIYSRNRMPKWSLGARKGSAPRPCVTASGLQGLYCRYPACGWREVRLEAMEACTAIPEFPPGATG
jgi:hypothetical protein